MCTTCSQETIEVLKLDFYNQMNDRRNEILNTEELQSEFGEAYDEIIQGYSLFVHNAFQGQYDEESVTRRQKQWEERFEFLINQVRHPTEDETEEGEDEEGEPLNITENLELPEPTAVERVEGEIKRNIFKHIF